MVCTITRYYFVFIVFSLQTVTCIVKPVHCADWSNDTNSFSLKLDKISTALAVLYIYCKIKVRGVEEDVMHCYASDEKFSIAKLDPSQSSADVVL